jgi:hypothetical protein
MDVKKMNEELAAMYSSHGLLAFARAVIAIEFETHCPDGQRCGANTTGCLIGQCLRNINGELSDTLHDNPTRRTP